MPKPRRGRIPRAQEALVAKVVADGEVTEAQLQGLSMALQRPESTIKHMIQTARRHFNENAEHYVKTHREVVDKAAASEDPKALEVAVRGSQWAIEHMSADGERIIDKDTKGPSGVQVFVGLKFGGMKTPEGSGS